MSVYTRRLVGPVVNAAANAWATVGTVPANKVWVLRTVLLAVSGADSSLPWLAVNGTALGNRVWIGPLLATNTGHNETLRLALTAGETLRYRCTVTALSGTLLTITGYEFDA